MNPCGPAPGILWHARLQGGELECPDGLTTPMNRVGADAAGDLFRVELSLGVPDIVKPHDFSFQLRHYVVAPEVRDGSTLVEIIRLRSGSLVKVEVRSAGSVEEPRIEVAIVAPEPISSSAVDEVRAQVAWRLGFDDDLKPFYALVRTDEVLSASIAHNYGAKAKSSFSMFDAVIDVICAQNTAFRRLYAMKANLVAAFGDGIRIGDRVYRASPTPERLAEAPLAAIRECGVGYRDRYIRAIAEEVAEGFDIERLKTLPREAAREQLMRLPGVGPYTADLGLIIGARRQDALFLDSYVREVLRQFYFAGGAVSDEELSRFAEQRWGAYQGYAWLYLSTNTEVWARRLGVALPVKSGALSDPDPE